MTVDNRVILNDCEGPSSEFTDTAKTPVLETDAGLFYEGIASMAIQHSNSNASMLAILDTSGSVFSLSAADFTFYLLMKDGFVDSLANGGVQFALSDGINHVGFDIAGFDAPGMDIPPFFRSYKLDASNLPSGSNQTYAGTEGSLNLAAITEVGQGTLHLLKAVGNTPNCYVDTIAYIANGSYAFTINGGTAGSPETMADVQGDDTDPTGGWGCFGNPFGSAYTFFAPTEWGEPIANAEHAFSAISEQWFWQGDHGGGHAIGAGNFPFRLVANSTDTGSFIITNVSIVATGTRAEFLMNDANFDTIEVDGCTFTGLATISLPSAGGTSRFVINTIFTDCDQITHNGANMSGSSVLASNVAEDDGAVFYNETADPDGEMDNMVFTKGVNFHHAIRFGTNVTASITLRGCTFVGFGSVDDAVDAVFRFDATSGSLNLNLINCTTDGTFSVDDAAGITVTVVLNPVTTLVHVDDNNGDDLINCRVLLEAQNNTGDLPQGETVTITAVGAVATVSHTNHNMEDADKVVIRYAAENDYNGVFSISNVSANAYDYTMGGSPSSPATIISGRAAILATGAVLEGLTDGSGNISASRSFTLDQPVTGFARKSTSTPRFKSFPLAGNVVSAADGLTINVRLVLDE